MPASGWCGWLLETRVGFVLRRIGFVLGRIGFVLGRIGFLARGIGFMQSGTGSVKRQDGFSGLRCCRPILGQRGGHSLAAVPPQQVPGDRPPPEVPVGVPEGHQPPPLPDLVRKTGRSRARQVELQLLGGSRW